MVQIKIDLPNDECKKECPFHKFYDGARKLLGKEDSIYTELSQDEPKRKYKKRKKEKKKKAEETKRGYIKQGDKKCKEPGCDKDAFCKGVCQHHYDKAWRKKKVKSKDKPGRTFQKKEDAIEPGNYSVEGNELLFGEKCDECLYKNLKDGLCHSRKKDIDMSCFFPK